MFVFTMNIEKVRGLVQAFKGVVGEEPDPAHEEEREWSHSDQDRKRGKVWRGFEELPPHLLPHAGSASPLIFKASGGIAGSGSTFLRRTFRILHQETDCGGVRLADGRERCAGRPPKNLLFTSARHSYTSGLCGADRGAALGLGCRGIG